MANRRSDKFADLDITKDELNALSEALKNKEFVQLFNEYCQDITNPENIQTYQNEMTQLEAERGYDVKFINPEAGFVIKTSVDGNRKAYINVCYNDNVNKPSNEPIRLENGQVGRNWKIPHMLAPPREDFTKNDTKTAICTVYDVIFHPNTLVLASKFPEFRQVVISTALESVESKFNLNLDRKNLKFPKMKFKGQCNGRVSSVVRKPIDNFVKPENDVLDEMYPHPHQTKNQSTAPKTKSQTKKVTDQDDPKSKYTTPKYSIKQRSGVNLEDFRDNLACKMNAAIPSELSVEIYLPLLNSTADTKLDVWEKSLEFVSEKPAKYKLQIQLPYPVNDQAGNAKFDKSTRQLIVNLPVIRKPTPINLKLGKEDSGVESDHESPTEICENPLICELSAEDTPQKFSETENLVSERTSTFLDSKIEYLLPEFTYNKFKNTLAFTLHVKNAEPSSVAQTKIQNGIHIKFSSVSSGFYSVFYAFCVQFPQSNQVCFDETQIETWDNNVIVQISLEICDTPLTQFWVGLNENALIEEVLSEPLVPKMKESDESSSEEILVSTKYSDDSDEVTVEVQSKTNLQKSESIPVSNKSEESRPKLEKSYSYSESSGDELSSSQSPAKNKGILKRRPRLFNRSVSESSIDDLPWANSLENYNMSSDTCIPEEKEESGSSFKKTVRFNDNVSKQIFRMNSSILGQKKKNQRKNRNKKRSHDRRHSESELSETEDKTEQFRKKSSTKERPQSKTDDTEIRKSALKSSTSPSVGTGGQNESPRSRLDSGVCSDSDVTNHKTNSNTTDMEFQSDLIFDLDI